MSVPVFVVYPLAVIVEDECAVEPFAENNHLSVEMVSSSSIVSSYNIAFSYPPTETQIFFDTIVSQVEKQLIRKYR